MLSIFEFVLCAGWLFIGVLSSSHISYNISIERVTWFQAVSGCQSMGGHLVTIPDQQTWNELSKHFRNKTLWIGGRWTYDDNWNWTETQRTVNNSDKFINAGEQGNKFSCAHVIVKIFNSETTSDEVDIKSTRNCSTHLPFICNQKGKKILTYFHTLMTWQDAKETCKENGMQLASFPEFESSTGAADRKHILNEYEGTDKLTKANTYWIGLQHQGWKWVSTDGDGKEEVITFSAGLKLTINKQFDKSCLLITDLQWSLQDCNTTNHYVCAIPETDEPVSEEKKSQIKRTEKWIIIGCVVGGVVLIIILVIIVICYRRSRSRSVSPPTTETDTEKNHHPDDNVIVDNDLYSSN